MKVEISEKELRKKLKSGEKIKDCKIVTPVVIRKLLRIKSDELNVEIFIQDCQIEALNFEMLEISNKITLKDCFIKTANFNGSYFLKGLIIENCKFVNEVDFQYGGHNKDRHEIRFENNIFCGFVNFFDCFFEGPVIVRYNTFNEGTNLLGNKGKPYEVCFEIKPHIEHNKGNLELDGG